MKKTFLVFLLFVSATFFVFAQDEAPKYARSALTLIQLQYDNEQDKFTSPEEKEIIAELYQKYVSKQFPRKYDKHQVTTLTIPITAILAKPFILDTTEFKGLDKSAYRRAMEAKEKRHIEGLDTLKTTFDNEWNLYKNPNPDSNTQILRSKFVLGDDGLPLLPPGVHDMYRVERQSSGTDVEYYYYTIVDSLYYQSQYEILTSRGSLGHQKNEQRFKAVLKDYDIARQIVAKWFNYDGKPKADGSYFDMNLIAERGFHNASELDKMNAEGGTRSARSVLEEEGEMLLENSFLMMNAIVFYPNEPYERAIYEAVEKHFGKSSLVTLGARLLYESKKDGYTVNIITELWKLKWDDSILNEFYKKCWNNPEYFESTDMFEMEFVGSTAYHASVAFSLHKSKEQIFSLCLDKSMDKVFYKTQKDYEVFRPIVTLMQNDPYMAIDAGTKEGLSLKGGERFEQVTLAQKENGEYYYKSTGLVLSTDKKYIYSNNLNPDTEYFYSKAYNSFVDSVYNKKTRCLEPKVWHWIDYQEPENGKIVDGVIIVDELDPANKNDAKEIALVQKTLSALSIKSDSSEILKCQDPWDDNNITYYIQSDGRWIVVPQIGPDGKVLRGTVVKGAKLPAGTLLRQVSYNKD